jgi:hypothetical protein
MQMDEEVGKVSSPVPVMVCILLKKSKNKLNLIFLGFI